MLTYFRLALATLRRVTRTRGDLLLENLALRQQLAMYERQPSIRDSDQPPTRLISAGPRGGH